MQKLILGVTLCVLLPIVGQAQHGTSENGYWPMGYNGDTWTGVVSATNDETREITLTYMKRDKIQTFVGVLEVGYKVKSNDGTPHELKVSEIPQGTRLKVYYMERDRKIEGRKVKFHEIFRLIRVPKD
jgi:hypothetical protein